MWRDGGGHKLKGDRFNESKGVPTEARRGIAYCDTGAYKLQPLPAMHFPFRHPRRYLPPITLIGNPLAPAGHLTFQKVYPTVHGM